MDGWKLVLWITNSNQKKFLPSSGISVVGQTERWCCLRHLAQPWYVALGQALICGWTQNMITFLYSSPWWGNNYRCVGFVIVGFLSRVILLRVRTLHLCLFHDYLLSSVERPFFQLSLPSLARIQTRDYALQVVWNVLHWHSSLLGYDARIAIKIVIIKRKKWKVKILF